MRALCVFVVYLFMAPLAAAQDEHVRALDPWAAEALRLGIERSQTVRDLIAELERSDVIVHIETRAVLPLSAAGTTRLGGATASHRYVRIALVRDPMPVIRVAVLGHELQHACEIARSTAKNGQDMRALFEEIGRPSPGERTAYETEAAIRVSRAVWYEVNGDEKRAAQLRANAFHDE